MGTNMTLALSVQVWPLKLRVEHSHMLLGNKYNNNNKGCVIIP